jgi:hypothetical protein
LQISLETLVRVSSKNALSFSWSSGGQPAHLGFGGSPASLDALSHRSARL